MRYGEDDSGLSSWYEQVTPEGDLPNHVPEADPDSMRGRPPQWFPDPLAPDTHHRWWTGTGWSTHTHPPDGPVLPEARTRTQPTARHSRRVRRTLVAAAAVVIVLAAGGVATLSGHLMSGSDPAPTSAATHETDAGASRTGSQSSQRPPQLPPQLPMTSARPSVPTAAGVERAPSVTGWLLVPGVPAQARTVCASGLDAGGSPVSTAPIRCTFQGATRSGTVTCAPEADQPAGAVTTCTVTDALTDRSTRTSCAAVPAGLTCAPGQRLEITTR